jgi:hypothetical protein
MSCAWTGLLGVPGDTTSGLVRWVAKYQAFLFFPLLWFEALMLRVTSVGAVARREVKHVALETVLLAAQPLCYLAAVLLVLSPLKAVLFIAVQQGLMGAEWPRPVVVRYPAYRLGTRVPAAVDTDVPRRPDGVKISRRDCGRTQ